MWISRLVKTFRACCAVSCCLSMCKNLARAAKVLQVWVLLLFGVALTGGGGKGKGGSPSAASLALMTSNGHHPESVPSTL